ncbi:hypothetical protein NL676_039662, partial [Syzygium grande]
MDLFTCACGSCYDAIASEQLVYLSEPFGEDESFVPFLLQLFGGGEDGKDGDVLVLSKPFGEDESFVPCLLRLFGGVEELSEPFGEDESFLPFLLRLFGVGEEDEDADVLALPFGEDESFVSFLLRLFGGGEDDEDEDMLAPAAPVSEIEQEVHIEASDGSHQSQTESNRDENDDDQHIRQGTIEDFRPPARSVCNKHVCLYTLAACITSFALAYEISPLFSRGFYASCPQMFISIGNQVANLASYYFSKLRPSRGPRWMLATGAVPSVLL